MLIPFNEIMAAMRNGKMARSLKFTVAACTPDVISKIDKAIVCDVLASTVNKYSMLLDRTVPSAEKKITVVATSMMMFELSLIACKSGNSSVDVFCFFSCWLNSFSFVVKNSKITKKSMLAI